MQPVQWLDFAESIATAIGHSESPRDADRRRKQGRAAGLWTKEVPQSRGLVDLILAYAAAGNCLKLEANDVEIGTVSIAERSPIITDSELSLYLTYSLFGGEPSEKMIQMAYRNNIQRVICTGKWLQLNIGQVRFGSLIPQVTWDGQAAKLTWSDPPQVQFGSDGIFGLGILRRVTNTTLSSITIGRDYGDFETSGVIGWGLPRLRWM